METEALNAPLSAKESQKSIAEMGLHTAQALEHLQHRLIHAPNHDRSCVTLPLVQHFRTRWVSHLGDVNIAEPSLLHKVLSIQIYGKTGAKEQGVGLGPYSNQKSPPVLPSSPGTASADARPEGAIDRRDGWGLEGGKCARSICNPQYMNHSSFSNLFSSISNEPTKDKYIAMGRLGVGGVRKAGGEAGSHTG